jgi:GH25 family lysozyme M1 (1,4-beta-N-acetylmuramidase)
MKNENVKAWQFTEKGTVNGITGLVDLNLAKNHFFDSLKKNERVIVTCRAFH